MSWRRFFVLAFLGISLSIGWGCVQKAVSTNSVSVQVPAPAPLQRPQPVSLPPATQAIVATAGPNGVFNPPRKDVRLVVISDLNSAYGSTDYDPEVDKGIALIPFWQPDLVLCSGDMVAGQKTSLSTAQINAMWQAFDRHVAAPLRQGNYPFGFTIGNHDASSARGAGNRFTFQQERDLAKAYWQAPEHNPGLKFVDRYEFPFYYTFEQQGIFFVVWDGSSSHIPADKLAWVEKVLSSPQAQQAKMRVLLGHLPLYAVAVGRDKPGEVMNNASQLQAMLERHKVHTYISGHQHAYYPAHKGNLQLLHTGLLGSGPRRLLDGNLPPGKTLTVIDVDFASPELTTYTTYDMQTLKLIEYQQLPRFLTGHNGMVLRRDIQRSQLSATEVAYCEQQLGAGLCGG